MQNRVDVRGPAAVRAEAPPADPPLHAPRTELRDFVLRTAVVAAAAALLFLAWQGRQALLLVFAAVVVAVIFDAAALPFRRWAGLPRRWALVSAALALAAALGLTGWLVGARVSAQFGQLGQALTRAEPTIRGWIGLAGDGSGAGSAGGSGGVSPASWLDWATSAASWGLGLAGALTSLVLVVVAGFFLASEPGLYRRGLRTMFPRDQHARVDEALEQAGAGLFQWLLGQLVSMALVGALTGLGAWAIGLPAPLALGLFAGLANFVPVVGSIAGAIPAVALAAAQGGSTLLWTAALVLAVQQVESNMTMPVVQRRTVSIPPALLLLAVFLFGALFGGVGVVIAAPLTVAAFVLVKKLYVVDVLEEEAELPAG
jgi:predicted PurR-regulated permease PerM